MLQTYKNKNGEKNMEAKAKTILNTPVEKIYNFIVDFFFISNRLGPGNSILRLMILNFF
jgi:hypothetical protein